MQQVYGIVSAAGDKQDGSGFTVKKNDTGIYQLTWNTSFKSVPGVAATIVRLSNQWIPNDGINVANVTNEGCAVYTMGSPKNEYQDRDFSIIAIGE
ncbi:hypothetical protein ACFWJ4_37590 [Kitasatospora sp. NPDC127067]|uniref:hypothetical protein n=1 Tax=Kitasatospora sp. NPDC127067 TaxID=3347126 RepID=UPI00365887BA